MRAAYFGATYSSGTREPRCVVCEGSKGPVYTCWTCQDMERQGYRFVEGEGYEKDTRSECAYCGEKYETEGQMLACCATERAEDES